jgi:signal transduction histidine kinase
VLATLKQKTFRALHSWRPEALVLIAIVAATAMGMFATLQDALTDFGFSIVKRPASGDIVLVQIDAKSLAAIDAWPWPRSRHAELIDKLTASGAELVALDVAFSSPSIRSEDERLAQTIRRHAGRVVLPSFVQHAAPGVSAELSETNPLLLFGAGALVGNANLFAPSGVTRTASIGLYLPDGSYRPTFAGLAGQRGGGTINEFTIDFGIDPKTFTRLSFADVLNDDFDAAAVAGKRVIVGATAIELGDRVPVPVYGVIAGVELQALMAESIWQGRTLMPTGLPGAFVIVCLVVATLRPGRAQWSAATFGARVVGGTIALVGVPLAVLALMPVLVEAAPGVAALVICVAYVGARELGTRASAVLRERNAANMRRAMISLIVEESSDGVLVSGVNARIELINERAANLLNGTRSTMLGRSAPALLPRFDDLAPAGGADVPRQTELLSEHDGEPVALDVSVRRLTLPAIEAGQPQQIDVYTLRDVTATRKAEDAERRAQEQRLMAERAKSNFIANMSHELRTPLNAIIGFSEIMANQTLGPVGTPAYIEYSDVIAKSGHHLLALINNVLEISRLDQNETAIALETIDFGESAAAGVAFIRGLRDYKNQNITIEAEGDLKFVADARLIKYVLINLLSNAVKFTADGANIKVAGRAEGDALVFEVSDDGVGIDPKLMPYVTQIFYQTDSSFTRKHEGMGVGLYLVKRHVDLLKGALHIESAPGKGTTVRVTLPGAVRPRPVLAAAA